MRKSAHIEGCEPESAVSSWSEHPSDTRPRRVVVIGIGNEFRTDDALGILVARQLKDSVPAGVQVVEASGEGAALMEAWKGAETAIIVDVVRSGAAPGSLHHIELSDRDLHYNILPFSSHAFGVTEAVATARILGQAPPRMVLLGIEGASFVYGTSLSDAVVRGLPLLLGEIERELHTGGTA